MTRETIILLYKLCGPLVIAIAVFLALEEVGLVQLNERTLPGPVYTLSVVLMFAAFFAIPLFVLYAAVVAVRFWGDWSVILPSVFPVVFAIALVASVAWPQVDLIAKWIAGLSVVLFGVTATWVGWSPTS